MFENIIVFFYILLDLLVAFWCDILFVYFFFLFMILFYL